jgi:dolichol-phosphate mannosyltransferase
VTQPVPVRPVVSIVFSFRNEESVLAELIGRVSRVFEPLPFDLELVFVNDASIDNSLPILQDRARTDPRIRVLNMSRRFGPSECAMAGLRHARGDAVILMDADLQDPPEVIPTLLEHWEQGSEVVHTVRTARLGEPWMKMAATRLAYRVLGSASNIELQTDAGDFKLFGRRALNELLKLPETTPYLRGLVVWIGFKQTFVPYERQARFAGRTHFPFFSRNPWRTFFSGLTSFSSLPLAMFVPIGVALLATGVLLAVIAAFWTDGGHGPWLMVALVLLSGLQTTALGIMGIYLARVYNDVRGRPQYIVESTIGYADSPATVPPADRR